MQGFLSSGTLGFYCTKNKNKGSDTQGITYGRKYQNHLHIRIIQSFEGLQLRPFRIFLSISISVFDRKKTAKGFYTYDGCTLVINKLCNFEQT